MFDSNISYLHPLNSSPFMISFFRMMKSENDMGFGYLVKVLGSYQETFLLACSLEESFVKVNDNLLDIKEALFTRIALRYSFSFPTKVLGFGCSGRRVFYAGNGFKKSCLHADFCIPNSVYTGTNRQ